MYPGFNYEAQLWIRFKDPEVLCSNPVIKGLDNYAELIGPLVIANMSSQMSGVTLLFFVQ